MIPFAICYHRVRDKELVCERVRDNKIRDLHPRRERDPIVAFLAVFPAILSAVAREQAFPLFGFTMPFVAVGALLSMTRQKRPTHVKRDLHM